MPPPLSNIERAQVGRAVAEAARLQRLGRYDEAARLYDGILRRDATNVDALLGLSALYLDTGRPDDAIGLARKALNRNPRLAGAHVNIGNGLQQLHRYDEAIERYRRALAMEPRFAEAHSNLGYALAAIDRLDEAIAHYNEALAIDPGHVPAHINLGQALEALNRHGEAIERYRRAQTLGGGSPLAAWNESLARLARGDFELGWPKYESRFLVPRFGTTKRDFREPRWDGSQDLSGKTIFVYAEQGLGDTLQFVRYVPLLARRGCCVVLEVQPPLRQLLTRTEGLHRICIPGEAPPRFDYHCPLLSLPLAFATRIDTIPAEVPYCSVPEDRTVKWQTPRRRNARRRVGFVSSGNLANWRVRRRNLPLVALLPLLRRDDVDFVCLQKDILAADKAILADLPNVDVIGPRLADFADTATVAAALDLVISVDTAVAHLAGALAKPLWVLLPFSAEWRWLTAREDSPWYPTARLFRQAAIGDWTSVVARVSAALDG